MLNEIDRALLNLLQSDFPLVPRPFAALGERLAISEGEVMERVKRLKGEGLIRQISAIFDSRALGYRSTLAALRVPQERLEEVASIVSSHSGVSHNYARDHTYNLWFTLTIPPGVDPKEELRRIAHRAGVAEVLDLPSLRTFKIGARFQV